METTVNPSFKTSQVMGLPWWSPPTATKTQGSQKKKKISQVKLDRPKGFGK